MKSDRRDQQPVRDSDIDEIEARDEAGVGALVDAYLPAEQIYLEAAASLSFDVGDAPIMTAAVTPTPQA